MPAFPALRIQPPMLDVLLCTGTNYRLCAPASFSLWKSLHCHLMLPVVGLRLSYCSRRTLSPHLTERQVGGTELQGVLLVTSRLVLFRVTGRYYDNSRLNPGFCNLAVDADRLKVTVLGAKLLNVV